MNTASKSLVLETSTAYFRDGYVPFEKANLSIASAPVLYGLSVYTVISATYNPKTKKLYIFRLRDHFKRLVNSAKIMDFGGFSKKWDYEKFEKAICELLNRNHVQQDILIRASLFIDEILSGTKMHGLATNVSIFVYPTTSLYKSEGVNVCISSWQRTPDNSIPSRAKVTGSYVNSSLMKNEALLNGYDDAIALDANGHVSESTAANLFIVKNGTLITPHGSTDILEGITRDTVQKMAIHLGIDHEDRAVDRSEIYTADEAFLCGSSARITPIFSVDKHVIGNGKTGSITSKLTEEYTKIRNGEVGYSRSWLFELSV